MILAKHVRGRFMTITVITVIYMLLSLLHGMYKYLLSFTWLPKLKNNLALLCNFSYKVGLTIGDQTGNKQIVAFGEHAKFIIGRPLSYVRHLSQEVSSFQSIN